MEGAREAASKSKTFFLRPTCLIFLMSLSDIVNLLMTLPSCLTLFAIINVLRMFRRAMREVSESRHVTHYPQDINPYLKRAELVTACFPKVL